MDLHTNLILNDTRFQQGLARSTSGVEGAMRRISRSLESVNQASQGSRKIFSVVQDITNAWTRSLEMQQRAAQGVATYREQWELAHGWMAKVANASPYGQVILDMAFNKNNGQLIETEMGIRREIIERSAARERELTLMRYQTEEERALIALEQQHNKEIRALERMNRVSKFDYSGEIRQQERLRDIQLQQLKAKQDEARVRAKAEADAKAAADEADRRRERLEASRSTFDFNERIDAEDTKVMRLKGFDAEADRREIEADTRRRIREVLDDQTVGPEELGRRLREVYRTSNERLTLLKEKPPDAFDRSITASGVNSATLGQMFGPTMTIGNSIAAKQAAAAEKAAAENKRQTELLKSIDRGIQRVGTRYAS